MRRAMLRLKRRPFFHVTYFGLELALFLLADLWLLGRGPLIHTGMLLGLLLLPLGLIAGIKIPVIMHNCVHGNFKWPWLNRLLGETAGAFLLLGMEAFSLNHFMHHAHADTDLDPHNPAGRRFLPFFLANNFSGYDPVRRFYLEAHGDTAKSRGLFRVMIALHFLNVPARLAFWVLALGPALFLTVFVPAYVFHMFVFSHINYTTHATGEDGRSVVFDRDDHWYVRLVNFFGSDVYFHRCHHERPYHYNPRLGAAGANWLVR